MNDEDSSTCMYFASVLLNVSPAMKIRFLIHLFTPKCERGGYDKDGAFTVFFILVSVAACQEDAPLHAKGSIPPTSSFSPSSSSTQLFWANARPVLRFPPLARANSLTFSFKPEGNWRERQKDEGRKTRKPSYFKKAAGALFSRESELFL